MCSLTKIGIDERASKSKPTTADADHFQLYTVQRVGEDGWKLVSVADEKGFFRRSHHAGGGDLRRYHPFLRNRNHRRSHGGYDGKRRRVRGLTEHLKARITQKISRPLQMRGRGIFPVATACR